MADGMSVSGVPGRKTRARAMVSARRFHAADPTGASGTL